jgi:hypothetical protein
MSVAARLVLLVAAAALTTASSCEPGPSVARSVQVTMSGCSRADIAWQAPPQEPATYDVLVTNRVAKTIPGWQTATTVFAQFSKDLGGVSLRSRDAAGQSLGTSSVVFFSPPRCVNPSILRVKVLLINLDPPAGDPSPWTINEARDLFFGEDDSVRSAIVANSFGRQGMNGDVSGYYYVNGMNHCEWNGETFNPCNDGALATAALAAADTAVDFSQYDRVALLMGGKGFGGTAHFVISTQEGGKATVQAPFRAKSFVHELGHIAIAEDPSETIVGHAGRVNFCQGGRPFPADPGNLLADCAGLGSSGDIEPMTSQIGDTKSIHYNAFHKERMGWIPRENIAFHSPSPSERDIEIHDVTRFAANGDAQILRIPVGPFAYEYFVEYRNEVLSDGTTLRGAIVRLGSRKTGGDWGVGTSSNMPDTLVSPSGPLVLDASQQVFDDPDNNVRIRFVGFESSPDRVRLRVGPSSGVAAP